MDLALCPGVRTCAQLNQNPQGDPKNSWIIAADGSPFCRRLAESPRNMVVTAVKVMENERESVLNILEHVGGEV